MFKFKDLSNTEDELFRPENYQLSVKDFFAKRRTAERVYLFDLRGAGDYEISHLPGAHNLPIEHFENSIYQMPFTGDILLYGGGQGETLTAAEILYDNGFDTFYYVDRFLDLYEQVDESFFTISPEALKKIQSPHEDASDGWLLAVEPKSPTKGVYTLRPLKDDDTEQMQRFEKEGIIFWMDFSLLPFLEGTEIQIDEDTGEIEVVNEGLGIGKLRGNFEDRVRQVLDEQVNPMVASHGGVVSLSKIENGEVFLRFGGGCQGCGMVDVTLKQGVEVMMKETVPDIVAIHDATDHDSGSNPYYR
ncbi:MAG: NifU family protein [SAR324 cluster bacterium]|nr:NifU family protein [SAR324 cluster bacterium]